MSKVQLLGIAIIVVALGLNFYPGKLLPATQLSEDEQVMLKAWTGMIDREGAHQLSSNLEAASNYFIIDSESQNPVYDSPEDLKWAKFNQTKLTNGVGINLAEKYPQFVKEFYELYERELGEDFSLRELVELNRKVAKVLRQI